MKAKYCNVFSLLHTTTRVRRLPSSLSLSVLLLHDHARMPYAICREEKGEERDRERRMSGRGGMDGWEGEGGGGSVVLRER